MKKETGLLAAILLLSIVLRSIGLQNRGIWYDDAFSIFLAQQSPAAIVRGTAADTMPPLYYFLLHFWMQLGGLQIWFLRLPGLILSLGCVLALYGLVRDLFDPRAGLAAAFLAAIAPFQIYHAQELRPYALLALAELVYLWCFVRVWRAPGRAAAGWWGGLILSGLAAMYSHNLAVFALAIPDIVLLVRRDWRKLRALLLAQAVIGLGTLPWLIYLPTQLAKIQGGWSIPRPGAVELLQALVVTTSNLPLPGLWLAAALLTSMWTLVLLGFELLRERCLAPEVWFLVIAAGAPPLLMLAASYLLRPVFVTRGFIVSILAYAGLAGYVIARRWPRMGVMFVGLFVAGSLIGLPYQVTFDEFPRSPYRQAAAYLQAVQAPGDRIIHDNKLSQFPMHFYAPELAQSFVKDPPGSHNDTLSPVSEAVMQLYAARDLSTAVAVAQRVYFVVFTRAIQEYAAQGQAQHPGLAWLRQQYRESGRQVFNDLEIYRFERVQP